MICITVCTRERPKMLRRLLESFENIAPDPRSNIQVIVVENGRKNGAELIVSDFTSSLKIIYQNEPDLGIVNARNAAVGFFLRTNASWMATIDDDEIISENWLLAMVNAIENYPTCKVFSGPQIRIFPEGSQEHLTKSTRPNPETGTAVWNTSTANALFHRSVFAKDGLGLRFHPAFNLSGGSDTHLFFLLKDIGEDVIWVREAKCFEPAVAERSRVRVLAKRNVQAAQNWGRSIILRKGVIRGRATVLYFAVTCSINMISFGVSGAAIRLFSSELGTKLLMKGFKLSSHALGYYKALLSIQGDLYRIVDGE